MRQLDPDKRRLGAKGGARTPASTNVTREEASRGKPEEERSSNVRPTTTTINDNVMSLVELVERSSGQRVDEPMEIVEGATDRNRNLSIHGAFLNRSRLVSSQPKTTDSTIVRSQSSISASHSLSQPCLTKAQSFVEQLIPDQNSPGIIDPRFYVCASFSQKTSTAIESEGQTETILPRDNLGSNVALNPIAPSSSTSVNSSQYHDYCLSEGEFDVTSSQSTPSTIARIMRKTFDENTIFDLQESLILTPNDDDVVMSPI